MYGINMFALVMFAAINTLAVYLCRCPEPIRKKTIRALCAALLFYHVCRDVVSVATGNGVHIHVEFSAVAYFAVPVILLTNRRTFMSWAAYSGLMAGFFYYATMIVAGGPIYSDYPPSTVYISLCCHGTLYLCGMVTMRTQKFETKDRYKLLGGVACVVANACLLRPIANLSVRVFIYELLDGVYVKQTLPERLWTVALPVYYALMVGLLILSVLLFLKLNRAQCRKNQNVREEQCVRQTVAV